MRKRNSVKFFVFNNRHWSESSSFARSVWRFGCFQAWRDSLRVATGVRIRSKDPVDSGGFRLQPEGTLLSGHRRFAVLEFYQRATAKAGPSGRFAAAAALLVLRALMTVGTFGVCMFRPVLTRL